MKHIANLILLLFFSAICFAQAKPKPAAKAPVNEMAKLLIGCGLPYKIVNDTLAAIPYGGANIEDYNVVIQKVGDLFLVYTNLSESITTKITEAKYKYLLQQNEYFDVIKIGMSGEKDDIYVRADIYKSSINTALLTRLIKQVANATNILAGELKKE